MRQAIAWWVALIAGTAFAQIEAEAMIHRASLKIGDKSFGRKLGKHAEDFGLDPKNPEHQKVFSQIIEEIHDGAEQIREGTWMGLGGGGSGRGPARFFISGNDVVVTDMEGNFVTVLKDGLLNNPSVIDATVVAP